MSPKPIDSTVETLRMALGQASRRAQVTASNLANIDTPGYRALEAEFPLPTSGNFALEMHRTDAGHLAPFGADPARGTIVEAPITHMRNDGNTVDVDREMVRLAAIQGRYRTAAEMIRKRFALLAYAATDGRSGG